MGKKKRNTKTKTPAELQPKNQPSVSEPDASLEPEKNVASEPLARQNQEQDRTSDTKGIEKQIEELEVSEAGGGDIKKPSPKPSSTVKVGSSIGASKTISELAIPRRGGPGSQGNQGRTVQVHANHFPLRISGIKKVNHYDVDIKAPWKRPNRKSDEPLFKRALVQLRKEHPSVFPPVIAFDGVKNIFTTQQLGFSGKQWSAELQLPESLDCLDKKIKLKFVITLSRTNIDLRDAIERAIKGEPGLKDEVQILNIVLSQSARESCQVIGRNYFPDSSLEGRCVDLPGGKSIWFGHFQSVNIGWKPFLNVDVANKPAVKQNGMIQFMEIVLSNYGRWNAGRQDWTKRNEDVLDKELKGLKVRYNRPDGGKREWRCNKVMDSADKLKFEIEENGRKRKITVKEYFATHMKYKLKYPHLPCLHLGSHQKQIYIPVELCELKAQALPTNKKLNEDETADMIKKTASTPSDRKARIEASLEEISNTFKNDKYAREFGITVESYMSKIPARVYDPPSLAYMDLAKKKDLRFQIPAPGGKWDMKRNAPRGSRPSFVDNRHLMNWAVLDLANTDSWIVDQFVEKLYTEGNSIGYNVEYPQKDPYKADPKNLDHVLGEFRKLCAELKSLESMHGPAMILVITFGKNASIYNGLKHEGDVQQKISTQVIQQKNVKNLKPATLHNILLKINSKLGGTNHTLHASNSPHLLQNPVMIMGADVTHPASDQKDIKPSIAAVVASMDPRASQYECEIRFQKSEQNEEMIHDMEEITEKLIRTFITRVGGKKPQRIIFYRDGVSEGQFLTVLNKELVAIKKACSRIDPEFKPPITYIVAQKRHKTRLFPVNPKDGVGKNQNVPPGTVVDHTITHPKEFSFFLASHEGIQGTTKPTNYHLLWDDWPVVEGYHDNLIKMTYYLCHVYARCERSVSYPAPTYYAHLAAFRARVHHDAILYRGEDSEVNRDRLQSKVGLNNYFM